MVKVGQPIDALRARGVPAWGRASMTRRFLRTVCRALIGVVLWRKMAISAYACPGLSAGAATMPVHAADSMDATVDKALPGPRRPADGQLRRHDGRHGPVVRQSLRRAFAIRASRATTQATLTVPAALPTAALRHPTGPLGLPVRRALRPMRPVRCRGVPPLAIPHCCFRPDLRRRCADDPWVGSAHKSCSPAPKLFRRSADTKPPFRCLENFMFRASFQAAPGLRAVVGAPDRTADPCAPALVGLQPPSKR